MKDRPFIINTYEKELPMSNEGSAAAGEENVNGEKKEAFVMFIKHENKNIRKVTNDFFGDELARVFKKKKIGTEYTKKKITSRDSGCYDMVILQSDYWSEYQEKEQQYEDAADRIFRFLRRLCEFVKVDGYLYVSFIHSLRFIHSSLAKDIEILLEAEDEVALVENRNISKSHEVQYLVVKKNTEVGTNSKRAERRITEKQNKERLRQKRVYHTGSFEPKFIESEVKVHFQHENFEVDTLKPESKGYDMIFYNPDELGEKVDVKGEKFGQILIGEIERLKEHGFFYIKTTLKGFPDLITAMNELLAEQIIYCVAKVLPFKVLPGDNKSEDTVFVIAQKGASTGENASTGEGENDYVSKLLGILELVNHIVPKPSFSQVKDILVKYREEFLTCRREMARKKGIKWDEKRHKLVFKDTIERKGGLLFLHFFCHYMEKKSIYTYKYLRRNIPCQKIYDIVKKERMSPFRFVLILHNGNVKLLLKDFDGEEFVTESVLFYPKDQEDQEIFLQDPPARTEYEFAWPEPRTRGLDATNQVEFHAYKGMTDATHHSLIKKMIRHFATKCIIDDYTGDEICYLSVQLINKITILIVCEIHRLHRVKHEAESFGLKNIDFKKLSEFGKFHNFSETENANVDKILNNGEELRKEFFKSIVTLENDDEKLYILRVIWFLLKRIFDMIGVILNKVVFTNIGGKVGEKGEEDEETAAEKEEIAAYDSGLAIIPEDLVTLLLNNEFQTYYYRALEVFGLEKHTKKREINRLRTEYEGINRELLKVFRYDEFYEIYNHEFLESHEGVWLRQSTNVPVARRPHSTPLARGSGASRHHTGPTGAGSLRPRVLRSRASGTRSKSTRSPVPKEIYKPKSSDEPFIVEKTTVGAFEKFTEREYYAAKIDEYKKECIKVTTHSLELFCGKELQDVTEAQLQAKGLSNFGLTQGTIEGVENSCHMAALLQSIIRCPSFVNQFLGKEKSGFHSEVGKTLHDFIRLAYSGASSTEELNFFAGAMKYVLYHEDEARTVGVGYLKKENDAVDDLNAFYKTNSELFSPFCHEMIHTITCDKCGRAVENGRVVDSRIVRNLTVEDYELIHRGGSDLEKTKNFASQLIRNTGKENKHCSYSGCENSRARRMEQFGYNSEKVYDNETVEEFRKKHGAEKLISLDFETTIARIPEIFVVGVPQLQQHKVLINGVWETDKDGRMDKVVHYYAPDFFCIESPDGTQYTYRKVSQMIKSGFRTGGHYVTKALQYGSLYLYNDGEVTIASDDIDDPAHFYFYNLYNEVVLEVV